MAAVTVTAVNAKQNSAFRPFTIAGTAFSTTTPYLVNVIDPTGAQTGFPITTDGGGAFTLNPYVPQDVGTITVNVYPITSPSVPIAVPNIATLGTATATGTGTVVHGDM